jgi:rSAM/selenodomain-associated transferase 1
MAALTDGRVAVIVFAKPPRPGQAKTRLASALGDEAAAELARAFVIDTWSFVRSLEWADPVLSTTDVDDPFWNELPGVTVWSQGDGDLGERMERAFDRALETHTAAIVIGSDVPGVPAAALRQARGALTVADVVIGPSEDGGFYLIGCGRALPAAVFAGIEWSTSQTGLDTERRLRSLDLVVVRVAPWFDVDEIDDLHRLRHLGDRLRTTAPETVRVLDALEARLVPDVRGSA